MSPTYKNLKSYEQAVAVCDLTVEFCKKYLNPKSRTVDQMEQAARSGKQNIVEGCAAGKHNPQTEIKLLGVARASFEELLEDYHDFLRQHNFEIWSKDNPRSLELRKIPYRSDRFDKSDKTYRSDMSDRAYKSYMEEPEKIGNAMITLINQTNYLLDQQIKGVKRENDRTGVVWEGQNQKLSRIQREGMETEKRFDEWIKKELEKIKIKNENV